tara:strand:+ start:73 stop:495 length:423 start_codon:yes stop_codon:yes gene_type:complete
MTNNLNKKVEELELSTRCLNSLKMDKINTIGDLVQKTEPEMLRTPNFGRKSLNELREILKSMDLSFGAKDIPEDIPEREKSPQFFREFNFAIIAKSKEAAEQSLKYITNKNEYTYEDITKDFTQHRKVMDFYEKALNELF